MIPGPYIINKATSFTVIRDLTGDGPYPGGGLDIRGADNRLVCSMTWNAKDEAQQVAMAQHIVRLLNTSKSKDEASK